MPAQQKLVRGCNEVDWSQSIGCELSKRGATKTRCRMGHSVVDVITGEDEQKSPKSRLYTHLRRHGFLTYFFSQLLMKSGVKPREDVMHAGASSNVFRP
jgi:hypothetical protein